MMENYRFDEQNFTVVDKVKVSRIAVDTIDNRTNAETRLYMLIAEDPYTDYRDRVKSICRDLGYSVVCICGPLTTYIDLETLAKSE